MWDVVCRLGQDDWLSVERDWTKRQEQISKVPERMTQKFAEATAVLLSPPVEGVLPYVAWRVKSLASDRSCVDAHPTVFPSLQKGFPNLGNHATVSTMRLVGRRALIELDGPIMAKRRLSLWSREVAAANWRSMSDVREAHLRADVFQDDRIRIEFTGQSVFVEAAISFPVALVCIERVGLLPTPAP
jgi:mRNA-degrading endonuclease HigB of HigAB toxin-antitoxin module